MKPESQRIAIAEACGLTNVAPRIVKNVKHEGDDITVGIWSDDGWVPQYLNDLNAMHDAEKVLIGDEPENSELWCDFQTNLVIACPAYLSYHATASQRAEAFLRTIGKWKEAK
jgi:hypothetical protein